MLQTVNQFCQPILWGWPVLLLILAAGIFYTLRLRGFQLLRFPLWMRCTAGNVLQSRQANGGISPFQSLTTALAGSIGTGNIVGVATAITLGGAGAIFWMWVSAFFGMATIYAEIVLGLLYRKRDGAGKWLGGAMYYLKYGTHKGALAMLFAGACVLSSFGMGNMTQSNALSQALSESLGIPRLWCGIAAGILLAVVLLGGLSRIASVTETVVPFMSLLYLLMGAVVLVVFSGEILPAFGKIFAGAFSLQSAAGGIGGYGIAKAMEQGLSRGIFTNEAGLGSSVFAHAAADTDEPCRQGMWGIFQVFLDTIVVCSVTALCILVTDALSSGLDGGALSTYAFACVFGQWGHHLMTICILFFAFATMLGWAYYGECAVRYLLSAVPFLVQREKQFLLLYRLCYAGAAVLGSTLDLYAVWDFCGNCNGLMALPNLYALFRLSGQVQSETQRFLSARKKHRPALRFQKNRS